MIATIILKYKMIFTDYFLFTVSVASVTGVCLVSAELRTTENMFNSLSQVLQYLESNQMSVSLVVRELLSDFEKLSLLSEGMKNPGKERYPFIALEGMEMSGSKTLIDKVVDKVGGTVLSYPPAMFKKYETPLKNTTFHFPFRFLMLYATAYEVYNTYLKMPVMVDTYFFHTIYSAILEEHQNDSLALLFGPKKLVNIWPSDLMKPDLNFYVTIDETTRKRRTGKYRTMFTDNAPSMINNIMNSFVEKPIVLDGTKAIGNVLVDALDHIKKRGLLQNK